MNASDVEAEYQRRLTLYPEAPWGWSFMYTPEAWLDRARLVLVGLNPGGSHTDQPGQWQPSHGENAYTHECWGRDGVEKSPLQKQVKLLFDAAGVQSNEVFAANLVPFRSPSWRALPDRDAAMQFGFDLWRSLLARTPARLFVSLGKPAGKRIAEALGAEPTGVFPVKWDPQFIERFEAPDGRIVLSLPHLSRYGIFGRERHTAETVVREAAAEVKI